MSNSDQPTPMRDIAPDVIRGFALLGILVVNIQYMAISSAGIDGLSVQGSANLATAFIVSTLFSGKFYLLFSLMYGYSSKYIIKDERSNIKKWIKRCVFFIALGFLHAIFLWQGDILFYYGLFGLVLALFFFRSDKTLRRWNIGIYLVSTLTLLVVSALLLITLLFNDVKNEPVPVDPLDLEMLNGSFISIAQARLDFWLSTSFSAVLLQGGMAFAAFLLGLRLSRVNYFSTSVDPKKAKKFLKIGLFVGLPLEIAAGYISVTALKSTNSGETIGTLAIVTYFLVAPLLSLAYIQILLLLISNRDSLVSWMAPAGRMSLTTYISQSIITSFIFAPWGLGLFQEVELWQATLLAVMIWIIQTQIAKWWLGIRTQGPLEQILSKVTR